MHPSDPKKPGEMDPDELAALIDRLVAQGTQHINLAIGAETRVQTVNSTACSPPGACAVPNFDAEDSALTDANAESDDDD